MNTKSSNGGGERQVVSKRLPKLLRRYEDFDFVVQQKVRFIYYLCIAIIGSIIMIILTSSYIQINNPIYNKLFLPIILPEVFGALIFFFCLFLLIKGYHTLSANLLILFSFLCVWVVMIFDKSSTLSRLDSIVFVLAVLATTPLLIVKRRYVILVYTIINLAFLFFYTWSLKDQQDFHYTSIVDYLVDTSISIIFIGIVSFSIYSINKRALDRAEEDIKVREIAESALIKSEKKFREMADLLPQTIFEIDLQGNLTYANKSGFEHYGYTQEEFEKGVNILSSIIEEDRPIAIANIQSIFKGEMKKSYQYTSVKKDGTCFPVHIFSSIINEDGKPVGLRGIVIDLSDIKNVEQELKKSRDQFQSMVLNIPGIIYRCLYDSSWTMLFVSSEIENLSGYPADDFINSSVRSYKDIIHQEDRNNAVRDIEKAVQESRPWAIEYRIIDCKGSIRWAYEKGRAITNSKGEVAYLDGFILDITERKNTDEKIKQSEQFRKRVFDSSRIPIVVLDAKTYKYIDVNAAAIDIYRMPSREALIGLTPLEVSSPVQYDGTPSSQKALYYLQKALNEGSVVFEWLNRRPDGELWDAEVHLLSFQSNDSMLLQFSLIDITKRKKAEEALKQSEELFKSLVELLPISVALNDMDGKYIMVNKAFAADMGLGVEDIIGKNSREIGMIISDESKEFLLKEQSAYGKVDNAEIIITDRDGRRKDLYYSSRIIQLNKKPVIINSTIDVTEKKDIERELEKHRNNLEQLVKERTEELDTANKELVFANRELDLQRKELELALMNLQNAQEQLVQAEKMASIGVLAAGVAHEINNPLNFINGGIQGIETYFKDNIKEHWDEVEPLIDAVNLGVSRASDIVKSLNRFSRQTNSVIEKCDLHSIINNCLVILQNEIKNRIDVKKNFAPDKIVVVGNEGRLHQAILNILTNSSQAISGNGEINISTELSNQNVVLAVTDSGHGIEKENLTKIFDPFFTTKEAGRGTGLGLSIAYQIIKDFNGSIEVQSEIGKGTVVKIIIPTEIS